MDTPSAQNALKTLDDVLRTVDRQAGLAAYLQAARSIGRFTDELRSVRVALLGTYTVDPVVPFLQVESARFGYAADIYVAPLNAIQQELISPDSGCARHRAAVVFVTALLEDVCPALAHEYGTMSRDEVDQAIERAVAELHGALIALRRHSTSAVVLHTFALPRHALSGIGEAMAEFSQTDAIRALNRKMTAMARTVSGVFVLDADRVSAEVGYESWYDAKTWYLARAPLSVRALRALAGRQARYIRALTTAPRKCLVLDLDNTLWGGVVGEAGIGGIRLGHTFPGNVYRDFQRAVLQLHQQGVILAINSKNNPADADDVFRSHPDMILRREHFAAVRINWQPKPQNMLEIAEELRIGLDALVFVDDDEAECALMRQSLPDVLTLDVCHDAASRLEVLRNTAAFEKLSLTAEDRRRGDVYQAQSRREQWRHAAASLDEFFAGLQMEADIRPVDAYSEPRVADLIQKTNQFNLTTRRYSPAELSAILSNPSYAAFSVRVTDRFGDNGIVGVAILERTPGRARVDTLLLSCRVIGRNVETALLAFVADWAAGQGAAALEGEFIPTAKNAPAADFYERHGFRHAGVEGTASRWVLPLAERTLAWPPFIGRSANMVQEV
jgi:FkbH-like protein